MKQLSNTVNCYASPESGKMNNDDTSLVKKRSKVLQIWLQNRVRTALIVKSNFKVNF